MANTNINENTNKNTNENANDKVDYLKVDKSIPGQNYVCLSFVSPEDIIASRERFMFNKFLKDKYNCDEAEYDNYINLNKEQFENEFKKKINFQTSIRGIKVRGTYDTLKEAEIRAKVLQKMDKTFNVFVGQVGYWLPLTSNIDDIKTVYDDSELNNLVGKYEENLEKKNAFFERETEERKKACVEENRKTSLASTESQEETQQTDTPQLLPSNIENILNVLNSTSDQNEIKNQFGNMNI